MASAPTSSNTTLNATADPPTEPQSEQTQVAKSLERPHMEQHSEHGDVVRDIIIGFADGLTVPFALTAGLSSYVRPFPPLLHG